MNPDRKLLLLAAVLGLAVAACSDQKPSAGAESGVADSRVGVRVNGQAIGAAELDSKSVHGAAGEGPTLTEARMKQVVDMELLRQAAIDSGLDQDETIRAKIAISQRTILGMAYLEKLLASVGEPSDAEVTQFYKDNPARFAERKAYEVQEFVINGPADRAAEIESQAGKMKTAQAFEEWLVANDIAHTATPLSVASDRLPDDVLEKFTKAAVGGTIVLGGKDQLNVVFILAARPEPMSLLEAKQAASFMLGEKRKREILDGSMQKLREKAKIEYVPPYTEKGLPATARAQ